MSKIAIIVVTYLRENSLKRLLNSLLNVDYLGDSVDLIISIDYSGNESIKNIATNFNWPFGEKKTISHSEKLGLRAHILKCGDFTNQYSHVCIIEDDLFVSPGLYNFAKQASDYYENDEMVAGISLYTHLYNHIANRPFYPIDDGFDVFFYNKPNHGDNCGRQKNGQNFVSGMIKIRIWILRVMIFRKKFLVGHQVLG